MPADIVVVGGGVAGVSCVERLLQARQLHETTSTTRLTFVTGRHGHLKVVTNYEKVGLFIRLLWFVGLEMVENDW